VDLSLAQRYASIIFILLSSTAGTRGEHIHDFRRFNNLDRGTRIRTQEEDLVITMKVSENPSFCGAAATVLLLLS